MTTPLPTDAEQEAAFIVYRDLKRKADESGQLADARAAGQAWARFLNLFLAEDKKMPIERTVGGNVAVFPVHRTRSSSISFPDGAA